MQDMVLKLETEAEIHDDLVSSFKNNSVGHNTILKWHSQITTSQIAIKKCQRDLESLTITTKQQSITIENQKDQLEELESTIVQLQSTHDMEVMQWEKQQESFESTLMQFEEERDRVYLSATTAEVQFLFNVL